MISANRSRFISKNLIKIDFTLLAKICTKVMTKSYWSQNNREIFFQIDIPANQRSKYRFNINLVVLLLARKKVKENHTKYQ